MKAPPDHLSAREIRADNDPGYCSRLPLRWAVAAALVYGLTVAASIIIAIAYR